MKTLQATWTGIRPLLMHNGLMIDPTNQFTKAIKDIVKKGSKKMTETDYEQRDRLEWEASLYWEDSVGVVIPADNIERCIQLGAQKSRLGKDVQAAVFCTETFTPISYKGQCKDKNKLYESHSFYLRKPVKIMNSRLIRIRPMFPTGWSIKFQIEFDDSIVNASAIQTAMVNAGALVGLGDWRPKFGRFLVS